jgi:hypothetical protein
MGFSVIVFILLFTFCSAVYIYFIFSLSINFLLTRSHDSHHYQLLSHFVNAIRLGRLIVFGFFFLITVDIIVDNFYRIINKI